MKKRTKTISSALLMLILTGIIMNSCGQDAPSEVSGDISDTSAEPSAADRLDELGERDFGGDTFTILDANGSPTMHINIPADEENGDTINDSLIKRNRFISDQYNINIQYEQVADSSGGAKLFLNSVLAGEKNYDMIFSTISGGSIGMLASEGVLADLCSMDWLSLDQSWWSPLVYDNCRIGGKMYYTTGDISPAVYCAPGCYYANKKLLADYSISEAEIYQKVRDGNWTLDYMKSLIADTDRDLNEDGVMKDSDDFFGNLNETGTLSAAVHLAGAGIKLNTVSDDGRIVCDLNNQKTLDAIEKLGNILTNINVTNIHEAFTNDRVIFLKHYVSSAYTRYRDMKSDFMILPMPKYDEAQSTYYSLVNTWCNCFAAVPINADTDKVGFIMEALAYKSHTDLRPQVYDVTFKNKGARNEDDAEMLDVIFDTLYLDFNSFMNFGGSMDVMNRALFGGAGLSSSFSAISDAVDAAINDFTDNWIGE